MKTTSVTVDASPVVKNLMESLRNVGYDLSTALGDIIDNSLSAKATTISILTDKIDHRQIIGIMDDGKGLAKDELQEAMRPSSKSPKDFRSREDLGRFGLGLKTASLSQCKRFTVVSKVSGELNGLTWDVDHMVGQNKWELLVVNDFDNIPFIGQLKEQGTIVVWEQLDRVSSDANDKEFNRKIDEAIQYIELTFHRFISGEPGLKKVLFEVNGTKLEARDPFGSSSLATQRGETEVFKYGTHFIEITPYTLPHPAKISRQTWEKNEGKEGYLRSQGFYIYREKRLITHGTWFGLARQNESTKLARVMVDMPNDVDEEWQIDVKKSSATPPEQVRNRFKQLIEELGENSKRTFNKRGARLHSLDPIPIWKKMQNKNLINYSVNGEHPWIVSIRDSLNHEKRKDFDDLLTLISDNLPVDALYADVSRDPNSVVPQCQSYEEDLTFASKLLKLYISDETEFNISLQNVLSSPKFSSYGETFKNQLIKKFSDEVN